MGKSSEAFMETREAEANLENDSKYQVLKKENKESAEVYKLAYISGVLQGHINHYKNQLNK